MDYKVSASLKEVYSQADYIIGKDIIEPAPSNFWEKKMEYNQNLVHPNSCFIHGFIGAISDLTGYKWTIKEIKELVDVAFATDWADESYGGQFQPACRFVCSRYNIKKQKMLAYYRVPFTEWKRILGLGHSIITGFNVSREIIADKQDDGIINHSAGAYGKVLNGHEIRLSMLDGKIYAIDNYFGSKTYKNIYEVKDIESECKMGNFFSNGYIYCIKEAVRDGFEGLKVKDKIAKLKNR